MTQTSIPKGAPRGHKLLGCLIGLALVLILFLIGLGIYLSSSPAPTISLLVAILTPKTGDIAEVGKPVRVSATAEYRGGIARVELYADGALVAVQQTTLPTGSNPLAFGQNWQPATAGRHILLARAYTRENKFTDSSIVYVDVAESLPRNTALNVDTVPSPSGTARLSLNEITSGSHVPLESLLTENPELRGMDPNAPLPPATTVEIPSPDPGPTSPGGGPTTPPPAPLPGTPAAPTGLNVTLDCTSAQLNWTDSADAEQYAVYRLEPGGITLSRIATLPAHTTIYRDTFDLFGEYRFQVASVRGGLEGPGPMKTAPMPGTCVPPAIAPGTSDVVISFLSIETRERYDSVYCYFRLNDNPFQRVPERDTQTLVVNRDGLTYNLQSQLPNRGQIVFSAQPQDQPITVSVECWGRRGATSTLVGRISATHPRAEWDGRVQRETAMAPGGVRVAGLGNLLDSYNLRLSYRIGPDTLEGVRTALDPRLFGDLLRHPEIVLPPMRDDAEIPVPVNVHSTRRLAWQPDDQSSCEDVPGLASVCGLFGYPVIAWDYVGNLLFSSADRMTGYDVDAYRFDVSVPPTPGIITYTSVVLHGHVSGGTHRWIASSDLPSAVSDQTCGYRWNLVVHSRRNTAQSAGSDPGIVLSPVCTNAARVTLRFTSLTLRNVNIQGEGCRAFWPWDCLPSGEVRAVISIGTDPLHRSSTSSCCGGEEVKLRSQTYGLDTVPFSHPFDDISILFDPSHPGYQQNNNFISLTVRDPTQTIPLRLSVDDADDHVHIEDVCGVSPFTYELAARSILEWQRIQQTDQTVVLRGTSTKASCELNVMPVGAPASP